MWAGLRSLLRVLRSRDEFEEGMREEMRFHIERYTEDLIRAGETPESAARRARLEFGGMNDAQEACRESRGLAPVAGLGRQMRHAGRLLRKSPGFTAAVLLTLAICVGANLTLFAVVDAILLRPLPFPEPERLVTMYNSYPKAGVERDGSSITNYFERRGKIAAFASLSMYRFASGIVGEPGATELEKVGRVTPEFFATLGTGLAMGRMFTEEETAPEAEKVVVLTDAYWRRHYDADPAVLGRSLRIEGVPHTVIGVLPAGFRFLSSEARIYAPFLTRPADRAASERHSGGNSRQLIARLAPGATILQAQAQIDAQNDAQAPEFPRAKLMADAGFHTPVVSLHGDHVAGVRLVLWCLQAGAFVLLLIGSVNVANLLLVRASGRAKEMAVRQALGAGRWHILSENAVETTLLTLAGGLLGLGVAAGAIPLLTRLAGDRLPLGSEIALNWRLAGLTMAGSIGLGLLLAIPAAWFHLHSHLQAESRGATASRAVQRLRHAFLAAQIALAVVLLGGAGLLVLSLQNALGVRPGFLPDHVLTAQIAVPWSRYGNWGSRLAFNARLLDALRAQPGVAEVGIANNVPLSGNSGKSAATAKGEAARPGDTPRGIYSYGVDGDYLRTMGYTLMEGRFLTAADTRKTEQVCVVDEEFARFHWPGRSALGQKLFQGGGVKPDSEAFTVVGVVRTARQDSLTADYANGAVYYPYVMHSDPTVFVAMRTWLPPELLAPALQRAVRGIDPELPVTDVRTMNERVSLSLATQRSPAVLGAVFSVVALLLTAIGTYGVLSYAVAQRRREIGVRMALGARPAEIGRQFLGMALRLLAVGVSVGVAGAWATGQAMRTILFHVPPFHVVSLAIAIGTIAVVSIAACLLPSRRAARISPMEALSE